MLCVFFVVALSNRTAATHRTLAFVAKGGKHREQLLSLEATAFWCREACLSADDASKASKAGRPLAGKVKGSSQAGFRSLGGSHRCGMISETLVVFGFEERKDLGTALVSSTSHRMLTALAGRLWSTTSRPPPHHDYCKRSCHCRNAASSYPDTRCNLLAQAPVKLAVKLTPITFVATSQFSNWSKRGKSRFQASKRPYLCRPANPSDTLICNLQTQSFRISKGTAARRPNSSAQKPRPRRSGQVKLIGLVVSSTRGERVVL